VGRLRPIFVITRSILWAGVLRYSLSCQFGVELQYCRWFEGGGNCMYSLILYWSLPFEMVVREKEVIVQCCYFRAYITTI